MHNKCKQTPHFNQTAKPEGKTFLPHNGGGTLLSWWRRGSLRPMLHGERGWPRPQPNQAPFPLCHRGAALRWKTPRRLRLQGYGLHSPKQIYLTSMQLLLWGALNRIIPIICHLVVQIKFKAPKRLSLQILCQKRGGWETNQKKWKNRTQNFLKN